LDIVVVSRIPQLGTEISTSLFDPKANFASTVKITRIVNFPNPAQYTYRISTESLLGSTIEAFVYVEDHPEPTIFYKR
jgi:hypothetical protein